MYRPAILIAGGDLRQLYCAARLAREYEIAVTGFDSNAIPEELSLPCADPDRSYDFAVLPVPPLDGKGNISTPCSSAPLYTRTAADMLSPRGCILAGGVNRDLRECFPRHEVCDYLLREELNLKNAVPTAEGAVEIALGELPVTLSGLDVLIVGMGRIGTALAGILKGFGAHITAAVRDGKGAARARLHGIDSVPVKELRGGYGLVFNTAPQLIFGRELLSRFGRDTLFIDLASKPGGIDPEAAAEAGVRVIWALGLPGKTAPATAGEMIAETVSSIIKERGGEIE